MMHKILLFIGVAFNILAQFTLKSGMRKIGVIEINQGIFQKIKMIVFNPYIILGIFFYGVGFFIYLIVISKVELSKAYPVASVMAIVLISIISVLFLSEQITIYKIFGVVFCAMGIFLILK